MLKWRIGIASAAFVCFLFAPQAARAQDCDRTVVDEAGVFGPDASRVEAAARKLKDLGADVRVRTVRDFAGRANLEMLADDVQRTCVTWRAQDGGFKPNLLVFMVSYGSHRGAALFFGETWAGKLGGGVSESIIGSSVVPKIRAQEDVAAFEAWSTEVGRAIAVTPPSEAAGTTARAPSPTPASQTPSAAPPAAPRTPPDHTILWIALGGILLIGVGVALFFVLGARKRREQERQKARREAKQRKDACVQYMAAGDETIVLAKSKLNTAGQKYSPEDLAPLQSKLQQAEGLRTKASVGYGKLDTGDNDPDRDTFATEAYVQIAAAFQAVEKDFDDSSRLMTEVEQGIETLARTAASAPQGAQASAQAIADADEAIKAIAAQGYRTADAETRLAAARASQKEAEKALLEKRFTAAVAEAKKAETAAREASSRASVLPSRRQAILNGGKALAARIAVLNDKGGLLDKGAEAVHRLEAAYAETCWEAIKGNGKEAEGDIAAATAAAKEAEASAAMEVQEWGEGERQNAAAASACEHAESLMRSIDALEKNLADASKAAAVEIEAALKDIAAARAYIKQYDPDIDDSLETDLEKAAKSVERTALDLKSPQPDVNLALKTVKQAHKAADEVNAKAHGEHEAAERLRQKAASALRDAEAACSKANEYLEDHGREVSAQCARSLPDAREALIEARAAVDPQRIIALAEKAAASANATYRSAKGEVDAARARREREEAEHRARLEAERLSRMEAERRSSAPSVIIPFPGTSSPSPSAPSPRGGGSVSIDGPSRRGGGSVAW